MADQGISATGIDDVAAHLHTVGERSQPAVDDALKAHGDMIRTQAIRVAPKATGALSNAITSTYTPTGGLVVDAHSEKVPHAYTFHATSMGAANGYMVFRVPRHTRGGYVVNGYSALRPIVNNAYLTATWEANMTKLADSVAEALTGVIGDG